MTTIIQRLREENRIIVKGLDLLEGLAQRLDLSGEVPFSDVRTLVYALRLIVEKAHNVKEERLLFPALAMRFSLKEGGAKYVLNESSEEHLAGHVGLLRIQLALDAAERLGGRASYLVSVIKEYAYLMREHVANEELRLLQAAEEVLSPEELESLFEKSCEIDQGASTEMLREMSSMIEVLWRNENRTSA